MSIWSSITPHVTGNDIGGEAEIDVATATAWHDHIRFSMEDREYYIETELTIEQAEQLIANLRTAVDRVRKAS